MHFQSMAMSGQKKEYAPTGAHAGDRLRERVAHPPMKNTGLASAEIIPDSPQKWTTGPYSDSYWALFEQSFMCMANLDLEFRILEANKSFTHQFGWSPVQGSDKNFCEF